MTSDVQLYIPEKIKVGYRKRADTYTGQLAYIIYTDHKGTLRKSHSWENWRDKSIEPEDFDNVPIDGFVLNKNIRRYGWGNYYTSSSYIRIWDPRGPEFEISPENLIALLMETNCHKREIEGKCVYAWSGKDLVLLPCSSEAYQTAVKTTVRVKQKVKTKDLKPGCSYTTKTGSEVIYLTRDYWTSYDHRTLKTLKRFIFSNTDNNGKFSAETDVSFLAHINNESPVQNYAELIEKLGQDIHIRSITSINPDPKLTYLPPSGTQIYLLKQEDQIEEYTLFYDSRKQSFFYKRNQEIRRAASYNLTEDKKSGKKILNISYKDYNKVIQILDTNEDLLDYLTLNSFRQNIILTLDNNTTIPLTIFTRQL